MESVMPQQSSTLEYDHTTPRPRLNGRILTFIGVVFVLMGFPLWTFVHHAMNHGIVDRAGLKEVDLKSMGFFEFDPVKSTLDKVPAFYRQLDGKRVLLKGQIWADNEARTITHFELVYSIQNCCFGGPPKVQERVFCQVPKDRRMVKPDSAFADVIGTLHVRLKKDGGQTVEIYSMDVESISAAD